jgi:hypothetical protein
LEVVFVAPLRVQNYPNDASSEEAMIVDDGAPQISMAQAEIEAIAVYWQDRAREAAETAARYTELAGSLQRVYRHTIAEAIKADAAMFADR